jgi:kinesin family protein C1
VHFEDDRLSCASQLAAKIEEISSYMRENSRLKEKLSQKEEEMRASKDSRLLLEVEKDLRVRAEMREENERHERIASTAQLLATQTECADRIHVIEDRAGQAVEAVKGELHATEAAREALLRELSEAHNVAAGRMSEILSLKGELEKASVNSEQLEELSSLKGEMEILKRRLQEKVNLQVVEGTHSATKIRELENALVEAEQQRRKLRNIIAELKGNVRVYARVRPFLPSDGLDLSANPESSIVVSGDSASVKIRSDKGEDQLFTFDKTFGPSTSQDMVFADVSEFVQSALDGYNVCLFSYGQVILRSVCALPLVSI